MALWSKPPTEAALIDRRAVEPDLATAPRSVALRVVDDPLRQLGSRRFVSSAEIVEREYNALHDALTDLPNRRHLFEVVRAALVVRPCQVVDSAGGWSADSGVVAVMVVAV